jgi:hypothetical protein
VKQSLLVVPSPAHYHISLHMSPKKGLMSGGLPSDPIHRRPVQPHILRLTLLTFWLSRTFGGIIDVLVTLVLHCHPSSIIFPFHIQSSNTPRDSASNTRQCQGANLPTSRTLPHHAITTKEQVPGISSVRHR